MGRKNQPPSTSGLKFRTGTEKTESKGMKPPPEPTTINEVLLFILQHVCRKLVFINTFYRVIYYLSMIFLVSIVVDFIPAPKISAARKDNFFNQYFVKVGWGWTLLILLPFVSVTSFVYCCGKRSKILQHVMRLAIATGFWLIWTNAFNYIESIYGRCNVRDEKLQTKSVCLGRGFFWQSVDISGHCFLLIYSTLVMIEEARVITNWEGITDYIRDEEFARNSEENTGYRANPLKNLDNDEFKVLKNAFPKMTPFVRSLFILLTLLIIIWECMLLGTVFYYHSMLEKFLAALTAVSTWYVTYYVWFPYSNIPPYLPGDGCFRYIDSKPKEPVVKKRQPQTKQPKVGPTFMGMPIRRPQEDRTAQPDSNHN
ncbi:acyl-coenzyme A diphosphatase Fitm [Rhodnius prolixus]|uniref:acyl-coenzyme A diphosphatase Fitm n=1 Tax=Rhodnius prolixus TaxID=13249 RepID=UPI003D18A829